MGKNSRGEIQKWDRKFGGRTEGFLTKEEERYEKKHLRAYLRGNNRFISGYTTRKVGGITVADPVYSFVKQTLTKIETNQK